MIRRTSCAHRLFSWASISVAALAYCVAPLSAQVHDNTLKGSGTNTSPLGVNIPLALAYNCNTPICYTTPALSVTDNLSGVTAVSATSTGGTGVYASGITGVYGIGTEWYGVYGTGYWYGVYGAGITGVYGVTTTSYTGVSSSAGVSGNATTGTGVYAQATGQQGVGLAAIASGQQGTGLAAMALGQQGTGIQVTAGSPNVTNGTALQATNGSLSGGYGAIISATCTNQPNGYVCNGPALWVNGDSYFNGSVNLMGSVTKPAGSFKIDHPLDPANKYLYHSFVESPDMMNIYNGNVHTDASGNATVTLPDWFEALNRDFRYQLTVIGQFAQAIVASEINNHSFTIKTDKPNVKVSWQVTGIRQDAWANAHRIPVEVDKPEKERGSFLYPEVHNQSEEKGVLWALFPDKMRELKEHTPGLPKR